VTATEPSVVVLAGGVGAARFLNGLVRVIPPERITVVVNVGDDLDLHGLRMCPDLDSITYWLADLVHPVQQWGRADERFTVRAELERLGNPSWFTLGDRDLALHLHRHGRLALGATLSEVTADLARRLGIHVRMTPVTNDRLETRIHTVDGRDLHFQEWWVRDRAASEVARVEYRGADQARPAPDVISSLLDADVVIVAPSNPVVSIAPILTVPGVRDAVRSTSATVVGISPVIAGKVVRGMADRLLPAVGARTSAIGVADWYGSRSSGGILDCWVVDVLDGSDLSALDAAGVRGIATDTLMDRTDVTSALARTALQLAGVPA